MSDEKDEDLIHRAVQSLKKELDEAGFMIVRKGALEEIDRLRAEVAELNNVLSRR